MNLEIVDMEISSPTLDEEDDEEDVTKLLNSLSGLERCFLPKPEQDSLKNKPNAHTDQIILVQSDETSRENNAQLNNGLTKHDDDIILDSPPRATNTLTPESRPTIDQRIKNLLTECHDKPPVINNTIEASSLSDRQIHSENNGSVEIIPDASFDLDVIIDRVQNIKKESTDDSITCVGITKKTDAISTPNKTNCSAINAREIEIQPSINADSDSSDCDIVAHIVGSEFRESGFIDLTAGVSDEETAKEDEEDKKEQELKIDDTEAILQQIAAIKKALLKRKKRKRRKKSKNSERRNRSTSRSRFSTDEKFESDEEKINQRPLCSYMQVSPSSTRRDRSKSRHRRRSRSYRSHRERSHSYKSDRHRRSRSRHRERSRSRHGKELPQNYRSQNSIHRRTSSPRRRHRSKSSSSHEKRRSKSRSSPLEQMRQQCIKENESAVKSLMKLNSKHQQTTITKQSNQLQFATSSTSTEEISYTPVTPAQLITPIHIANPFVQQIDLDYYTGSTHFVDNGNGNPQIPPIALAHGLDIHHYNQMNVDMNQHGYVSHVNVLQINRFYNHEYYMPWYYRPHM